MQRPPSLGEDLAATLRDLIVRDGLRNGDRLPTEKLLAEQYGVSRTVVREAIARLQTEGLVAARQGAGVFVNRRGGVVFRIVEASEKQRHFQNVYELRLGVEAAAAELAALRRDERDLADLTQHLSAMSDPHRRSEADTRFHIAVARATSNPLYESFVGFVGAEVSSVIGDAVANTITRHPGQIARVIAEHRAILEAIRLGDGVAARLAMIEHLTAAAHRLSIGLSESRAESASPTALKRGA